MRWTIVIWFSVLCGFLVLNVEADSATSNTKNVPLPEHTTSMKVDGRIVNGIKASLGQYPHLVSLRRRWTDSHFCGGNIISEKWILTAAHCMFRSKQIISPTTFYVVAGEIELKVNSSRRQKRTIEELFVHSKYNGDVLYNDIALVLLQKAFVITDYVRPIPLATKTPAAGITCIVAGWGYLKENETVVSNHLMYLDVPLLNWTTCKSLIGHLTYMISGQICAGYIEGKKDACQGDSGGPLVCKGLLTGVVSGGKGCARPKLPGFYTEVAHYTDWIAEVQTSAGSCCQCSCRQTSGKSGRHFISTLLTPTVIIHTLALLYTA